MVMTASCLKWLIDVTHYLDTLAHDEVHPEDSTDLDAKAVSSVYPVFEYG
jgi:hypothetical protein